LRLLIFIQENGPLQTENLTLLLNLICKALLSTSPSADLFFGKEILFHASNFLKVLILNHTQRSKKPPIDTGIFLRQSDPVD
jgi:hypothetical protein